MIFLDVYDATRGGAGGVYGLVYSSPGPTQQLAQLPRPIARRIGRGAFSFYPTPIEDVPEPTEQPAGGGGSWSGGNSLWGGAGGILAPVTDYAPPRAKPEKGTKRKKKRYDKRQEEEELRELLEILGLLDYL